MKGGKDEEGGNIKTPMFPRLHVNDRDEGGPRAPPRNKMALYEQLSIPSQRFNSGSVSHVSPTDRGLGPSSSQGNGQGRTEFSFCHPSPSMPSYSVENTNSCSFDLENMKSTKKVDFKPTNVSPSVAECSAVRQLESSNAKKSCRRVDDDDDFRVPTFDSHENASFLNKDTTRMEKNRSASSYEKPLEQTNSSNMESRIHERDFSMQKLNDHNDLELNNKDDTDRTCQELCDSGVLGGPKCINDADEVRNGEDASWVRNNSQSNASTNLLVEIMVDSCNRTTEVFDKSMVDPLLGLEISPDDVVGVIGPKQFWKARRAIVNQQRIFALQVFELHRLIKVQKLLAASPHLFLEENPCTIPQKVPTKNPPLEPHAKPQLENPNQKDDSQKSTGVPPLPPSDEGLNNPPCQPQSYGAPYSGNPFPPSLPPPPEVGTNPWCFPSPTQQWLVPVMSPSEGLIYKPCGGPWPPAGGFMGPLYGNYSPMSVQPHQQQNYPNYVPSPYGFPTPYGLPAIMNPTNSCSAIEQVGLGGTVPRPNAPTQQNSRSSCNMSFPKSNAFTARPMQFCASKENELQRSGACSSGEGRDALPLLPTGIGGEGPVRVSETREEENPTRAIRVVPHNARSASESAARIFKSIQKEKQQ